MPAVFLPRVRGADTRAEAVVTRLRSRGTTAKGELHPVGPLAEEQTGLRGQKIGETTQQIGRVGHDGNPHRRQSPFVMSWRRTNRK